ncbi:MAG: RNA-binding domain-containing protein [Candidatus Thermoplasmatota archaeon]|nr:RNA-binding domain-containing protein [Candidatus Thermoplasmatota archaeon]MDI6887594.1 RNA-binding domain-containing protein [Candidatus Thermoplasmatota archaeon]
MDVVVRASVHKTENVDKVRSALLNIFPELELDIKDNEIKGRTSSISKFKELLRLQKIRKAAKSVLLSAKRGSKLEFKLSKQVAFIGKVNFITDERPPLGSIEVSIAAENIEEVIEELTV